MDENKQGRFAESKGKRIDFYYENSNTLSLLGFEKILRGEPSKDVMN